jgi:CubicO group peptidase (beta-lactamase class C family)
MPGSTFFAADRPAYRKHTVRSLSSLLLAAVLLAACAGAPTATAQPTFQPATVPPTTVPTATPPPSPAADPAAAADALLTKFAAQDLFSGSVLIARDGQVLLSKGYGMADQKLGIANTPQTQFLLASVTKQFTAMAILILESQGKLDVQSSVCQYLPDCPAQWQPVTLHHLLTHTGGIPNFTETSDYQTYRSTPGTVDGMLLRLHDLPLDFAPGASFHYSNSGYFLLGAVIERVSGETYGDFLRQVIFEPLGMAHSGYDGNQDAMAIGYESGATPALPTDKSVAFSAGGLYSTVEDMYRWDQALYTERLVQQPALDRMFSVQTPSTAELAYGYGWAIGTDSQGGRLVIHSGGFEGFRTIIARHVDDRLVIILLCNQQNVDTDFVAGLLFDKVVQP